MRIRTPTGRSCRPVVLGTKALLLAFLLSSGCERSGAQAEAIPFVADNSVIDAADQSAAARAPVLDAAHDGGTTTAPVSPSLGSLRIESESDGASSELHVLIRGEHPVDLPEAVAGDFENSLSPVLLHESVIVYDGADAIFAFDVESGTRRRVLPIPRSTDVLDYRWVADDGRTVAVIHRSEHAGPTTVAFVSIAKDGSVTELESLTPDPAPLIRCASRCYVAAARFDSPSAFEYLVSGGPEDPVDPEAAPVMKTIAIGNGD